MPILTFQDVVNLVQPYAGAYASDPLFLTIVASGAKAESGWNTDALQPGGGAMGLFQFDPGGAGKGLSFSQLSGIAGAQFEASRIVPEYATNYAAGQARGLTGQNLATFVIGASERPNGWSPGAVQWSSPYHTWENYVNAFSSVISGPAAAFLGRGSVPVTGTGGITTDPTTGAQTQTAPPIPLFPGQTQTTAQAADATQISFGTLGGNIGPYPINTSFKFDIPSGLVLGLIGVLLLILGVLLFSFNVQNRITNKVSGFVAERT